jgi:hypothetical protein
MFRMPGILQVHYHEFQDALWIFVGTMLMQVCYCKSSNFDFRKDFLITSAGHLLNNLIFTQSILVQDLLKGTSVGI